MLFHEREQQREFEKREREGEQVWTSGIRPDVRRRIVYTVTDLGLNSIALNELFAETQRVLERRTGFDIGNTLFASETLPNFLNGCDNSYFLSTIELFYALLERKWSFLHDNLEIAVNEIFSQERISYEMISGEIIPFSSRELHVEIVEPVLRLLGGRSGWEEVETTYQKALHEIGVDPGDAITDATTALQLDLTILGCKGNALGPLTQSAMKMGLLAKHDRNLLDWLSADRSSTGDAHRASSAGPGDAWFTIHVSGALILRLVSGGPRGATQ